MFVFITELATTAVGSVTVVPAVVVQLFASDTVTVYVPATSPLAVAVVAKVAELVEVLHAKLYGAVPPEPLAVADPSFPPLQLMFVFTTELATTAVGSVMAVVAIDVQLFASVTVTVYVPATNPFVVAVVAALLHAKV